MFICFVHCLFLNLFARLSLVLSLLASSSAWKLLSCRANGAFTYIRSVKGQQRLQQLLQRCSSASVSAWPLQQHVLLVLQRRQQQQQQQQELQLRLQLLLRPRWQYVRAAAEPAAATAACCVRSTEATAAASQRGSATVRGRNAAAERQFAAAAAIQSLQR